MKMLREALALLSVLSYYTFLIMKCLEHLNSSLVDLGVNRKKLEKTPLVETAVNSLKDSLKRNNIGRIINNRLEPLDKSSFQDALAKEHGQARHFAQTVLFGGKRPTPKIQVLRQALSQNGFKGSFSRHGSSHETFELEGTDIKIGLAKKKGADFEGSLDTAAALIRAKLRMDIEALHQPTKATAA